MLRAGACGSDGAYVPPRVALHEEAVADDGQRLPGSRGTGQATCVSSTGEATPSVPARVHVDQVS